MLSALSSISRLSLAVRTNKELRREAYSMSIYVAIVLLSALSVFDDDHPPDGGEVFLLELGTTVGLVLAHAFASWISTTIMGGESSDILRRQRDSRWLIAIDNPWGAQILEQR